MPGFAKSLTSLVTTFDVNGRFDAGLMRRHVDFVMDGGSDGVCVGGVAGEGSSLTRPEWEQVVGTVREHIGGRGPVLACSGANSTSETVSRSKFSEAADCDAVVITVPCSQAHSKREIYRHLRALRETVSVPIILDESSAPPEFNMSVELLEQMAREELIQGIALSARTPDWVFRLGQSAGGRLDLLCGQDQNVIGPLSTGAKGWISSIANVDPRRCSQIHRCFAKADYETGCALWAELYPFLGLMISESGKLRSDWIAVMKTALASSSRPVGAVRPPKLPLIGQEEEKVMAVAGKMAWWQ